VLVDALDCFGDVATEDLQVGGEVAFRPAGTLAGVQTLSNPEHLIEVDAIADTDD
jgi:hypothetical protein